VPRRLVLVVVVVVAVAWLGFRAVRAFDRDRHAAVAAAVLAGPDVITHQLLPVPAGQTSPPPRKGGAPEREGSPAPGGALGPVHSPGASGRLAFRPGTRLTVVDLRGLAPVAGDERYLVFVRSWAGWTLAGAVSPQPDGTARVSSAAEPKPTSLFEVVVTRAVDDATSVPHGRPVLQWYDASLASPRARKFEFAEGA
jgi:hypothetical protein